MAISSGLVAHTCSPQLLLMSVSMCQDRHVAPSETGSRQLAHVRVDHLNQKRPHARSSSSQVNLTMANYLR